jgi:hypothetical protein
MGDREREKEQREKNDRNNLFLLPLSLLFSLFFLLLPGLDIYPDAPKLLFTAIVKVCVNKVHSSV